MRLWTQLFLGFAVVFVLMTINAAVMYTGTNHLVAARDRELSLSRSIASARSLQTTMMQLRSADRGFLLSAQEEFLEPFVEARAAFSQRIESLKKAVLGNSTQIKRLEDVESSVNGWIETTVLPRMEARRKAAKQEAGLEAVLGALTTGNTGKIRFKDAYKQIETFVESQRATRRQQAEENRRLATRHVWSVILGTVVAVLFGTGIMLFTTRTVYKHVGGEPATIAQVAEEIGKGDFEVQFDGEGRAGTGIRSAMEIMLSSLKQNALESSPTSTDFAVGLVISTT